MPSAPLPSIFPSIMNFSIESAVHIRWPKYWSFSISISSSSEYSELISLKSDWFDFFAVQETFRSLLQYQSSNASILWHSAFFTVQLSQPYMTIGKTTTLTIRIFVGRVMSLLFFMILYHCSIIQNNSITLKIPCDSLISPSLYHAPGTDDLFTVFIILQCNLQIYFSHLVILTKFFHVFS